MHVRALTLACAVALTTLMAPPAAAEDAPSRGTETLLEGLSSKAPEDRADAAHAAAESQDAKLLAPLVKALKDKDAAVRSEAIFALGKRADEAARKKAALALVKRVRSLEDKGDETAQDEAWEAAKALHDLAQPAAIKGLMDGLSVQQPEEVVEARLMAVANTPSRDAVDELISFLSKGRRRGAGGHQRACLKALRYATGEKLRADPDVWRAWWKDARKGFDLDAAAAARAEQAERAARKAERKEARKAKGDSQGKGGKQRKGGGDDQD